MSCLQSFPVFHGDIFVHVNLSRNELGRPWVPTEEDIEVVGMTSGSHIGVIQVQWVGESPTDFLSFVYWVMRSPNGRGYFGGMTLDSRGSRASVFLGKQGR